MHSYDIVLVSCAKDFKLLPYCIRGIKQFVRGFRRIYMVTNVNDLSIAQYGFLDANEVHIIDESNFKSINKPDITPHVRPDRTGWYYQQLLKLYASHYIPSLSEKYLVIDSDLVFLKPFVPFDDRGTPLYAFGDEHNKPYFTHMARMHPTLHRARDLSGICHHMMFDASMLQELFSIVEAHHQKPFWKAFLECVDPMELSGASEYEIYFNFMSIYHPNNMVLRALKWRNWWNDSDSHLCITGALDFIGLHSYQCPPDLGFLDRILNA